LVSSAAGWNSAEPAEVEIALGICGEVKVRKSVLWATALGGLAALGYAADARADDDSLTWHGITLYGTVDVGAAYQTHGAPVSSSWGNSQFWLISRPSGGSQSMLTQNGLSASTIGIKVEENLGYGFTAIAKADTQFVPLSGEIADGPASLLQNAGRPLAQQASNSDSGRAGQTFNGALYAGISSASYGTLLAGRQASLIRDTILTHDPQSGSYAFSLIGNSGTFGGGGLTENTFLDNSVSYIYEYGSVHGAALYSKGGEDTGQGGAYQFSVGTKYAGFALDAAYSHITNGVSLSTPATLGATTIPATLANTKTWTVAGEYTFNIGGGSKDGAGGHKAIIYAGYENISFSNPDPNAFIPTTSLGGFALSPNPTLNNYDTGRVLQVEWVGLKYYWTPDLSLTGAYYREDQNSFVSKGKTAAQTALPAVGVKTAPNASGSENAVSFVADYAINKHWDIYAGVNYSNVSGGLASGFLNTNEFTPAVGARLRF
jgi:predicted porin